MSACGIIGCVDPGCTTGPRRTGRVHKPKPRFARLRRPTKGTCRNCRGGRHGHWCCAALFGPWCPCRCRAVLGLDSPFESADPTAPDDG